MNPETLIDVLLPAYNAAETLEESLQSLECQSLRNFRVITIDDGSTDATCQVLAKWQSRDTRFTYLTVTNGGIVNALNTALSMASAPI